MCTSMSCLCICICFCSHKIVPTTYSCINHIIQLITLIEHTFTSSHVTCTEHVFLVKKASFYEQEGGDMVTFNSYWCAYNTMINTMSYTR